MPDLKSPNIVDLFEVVEDLGFHYDELSYSGQEVYEKLAKLVGKENYKIYSNAFPNTDPEIETEEETKWIKIKDLN